MSDTLGGLVDKLGIVNLKMWNNQELLYDIRKMTSHEFYAKYSDREGMDELYECLKKCCDLNVQRNDLIDEVDNTFTEILHEIVGIIPNMSEAEEVHEHIDQLLQKKHKSYSKDSE